MPKIPAQDNFTEQNLTGTRRRDTTGQQDAPGGTQSPGDLSLMNARFNEASVTDAHAGLLNSVNAILNDPNTGYLNLQGKDAVDGLNAVADALSQAPKQMSDNLPNDEQRAMFDKVSGPTVRAAIAQVQQHAARQMAAYEGDASRARAAAAADFAVNVYNPQPGADNSCYRQALLTQKIELEKQAEQQGLRDPTLRDHYIQFGQDGTSGIAGTYSNIVTTLLNNDQAQAAQSYFDRVKDELPEPIREKLSGFVEDALHQHDGLTAALHAQAQSPDPAKQQEILDSLLNDGKISDAAHAAARQTLDADQARIANQQTDNDKQILARVWDLKNNNPHPAITDLSAADYAYLKSRKLDTQAQAILNGHPAQDDPALFNELHGLSAQDPVKFAQTNLLADSGNLSKAHMTFLQNLQDAINKQDPKQVAENTTAHNAINTVLKDLRTKIARSGRQAASQERP